MKHLETFEQWQRGLRIFHRCHTRAAVVFERRNIALGLPTVILTAVAGTAVFTTIESSPETWMKVLTGTMSLTAAVLAALQTFLRYSELSEWHKAAAQKYGMLRRELEEALAQSATTTPPSPLPVEFTKSFRERWDALDNQAPNIPQWIYDQVEKQLASSWDSSAARHDHTHAVPQS